MTFEEIVIRCRRAQRIAVLTGAGISAESGVPTFRDAQTGLWARYKPEELATPEAFQRNPKQVWDWYTWRRERVLQVQPNAGHYAISQWEQHVINRGGDFALITQNVDGLHKRAGSQHLLELHGNLFRTKRWTDGVVIDTWSAAESPPRCPQTGALLRPDVVWFGEMLPHDLLREAMRVTTVCEIFLCVGTSTQVYPAAELPFIALRNGAIVIEVNPQPTPLTPHAHYVFAAAAGHCLPPFIHVICGSE